MTNEHTERPSVRFEGETGLLDLEQEAADLLERSVESPHGHAQRTLYRHAGATIAMFAFRAGAQLPPHAADGVVSVHVLRGHVTMQAGASRLELPAGQMLRLAPGVTHDVSASEPSVILTHIASTESAPSG
ncbi:MAG: cupin domain-containing protein [Phycisphaerales bacterium JB059]